jgi:hypothetical protein
MWRNEVVHVELGFCLIQELENSTNGGWKNGPWCRGIINNVARGGFVSTLQHGDSRVMLSLGRPWRPTHLNDFNPFRFARIAAFRDVGAVARTWLGD